MRQISSDRNRFMFFGEYLAKKFGDIAPAIIIHNLMYYQYQGRVYTIEGQHGYIKHTRQELLQSYAWIGKHRLHKAISNLFDSEILEHDSTKKYVRVCVLHPDVETQYLGQEMFTRLTAKSEIVNKEVSYEITKMFSFSSKIADKHGLDAAIILHEIMYRTWAFSKAKNISDKVYTQIRFNDLEHLFFWMGKHGIYKKIKYIMKHLGGKKVRDGYYTIVPTQEILEAYKDHKMFSFLSEIPQDVSHCYEDTKAIDNKITEKQTKITKKYQIIPSANKASSVEATPDNCLKRKITYLPKRAKNLPKRAKNLPKRADILYRYNRSRNSDPGVFTNSRSEANLTNFLNNIYIKNFRKNFIYSFKRFFLLQKEENNPPNPPKPPCPRSRSGGPDMAFVFGEAYKFLRDEPFGFFLEDDLDLGEMRFSPKQSRLYNYIREINTRKLRGLMLLSLHPELVQDAMCVFISQKCSKARHPGVVASKVIESLVTGTQSEFFGKYVFASSDGVEATYTNAILRTVDNATSDFIPMSISSYYLGNNNGFNDLISMSELEWREMFLQVSNIPQGTPVHHHTSRMVDSVQNFLDVTIPEIALKFSEPFEINGVYFKMNHVFSNIMSGILNRIYNPESETAENVRELLDAMTSDAFFTDRHFLVLIGCCFSKAETLEDYKNIFSNMPDDISSFYKIAKVFYNDTTNDIRNLIRHISNCDSDGFLNSYKILEKSKDKCNNPESIRGASKNSYQEPFIEGNYCEKNKIESWRVYLA